MEKFNDNIKIIAVEAIAKSRLILSTDKKIKEGLCLQIVIENGVEVQDQLYKIDDITTFNAFDDIIEKEIQDNYKALLFERLSDEQVKQVNGLLK